MGKQKLLCLFLTVSLYGCSYEGNNYPFVVSASYLKEHSRSIYTVQQGDTIYSIAWHYDLDVKELASFNKLSPPYRIYEGQKIYIKKRNKVILNKQVKNNSLPKYSKGRKKLHIKEVEKITERQNKNENISNGAFAENMKPATKFIIWPAKGKLVKTYSNSLSSKGIEIAGRLNDPIYSIEDGTVVYAGHGIRGYGNLLIIKHKSELLSAYANNNKLLVKEGAHVVRGQKIALMGIKFKKPTLHFEIRKFGKSSNPLLYLPKSYG
jgi:lipoprotein NlpD